MKKPLSRRRFLAGAAAGSAALGFPAIVRAQAPIHAALPEHLAAQVPLPRVRGRLDQEGRRDHEWPAEGRHAARGRGGAGAAGRGRGQQGRARRRTRHPRLLVRQEHRLRPLRRGTGLRHGRDADARLDRVRRRQGPLCRDPGRGQPRHPQPAARPGAVRAVRLVQEGDPRAEGPEGPEDPHLRPRHRQLQRARHEPRCSSRPRTSCPRSTAA